MKWLVALSSLPGMGPVRMRAILDGRSVEQAWELARRDERWSRAAACIDVDALWQAHVDADVDVLAPGDAAWPDVFHDDPEPPALLFARGDLTALDGPRVAITGTRRCTYTGRDLARELGRDLADAGVRVVSGLAAGIDGAAHGGALQGSAPPVGVVGTGLDVVYPRWHGELWHAVATRGLLLSEYPLGVGPERWRFPARNRLIAALADVVVVIESHASGGSMHTVDSALERDRTVMAMPGSVRSPASAGTNALLAAGAPPARDAGDVLVALGLDARVGQRVAAPTRPGGDAGAVLDALGWQTSTLEHIADRAGAPLGPVAVHLAGLERDGWLRERSGWYERLR